MMKNKFELVLDYDLTIKNAPLLRESLLKALELYKNLTVVVNPSSNIDLSGMQLLLAAKKQAVAAAGELTIHSMLSKEVNELLEKAGFQISA
jgi:anti-anti-sigma regulatory factor